LTVSPGDPVALAAAINELLDDPGLCATFGHAARARAEEQFNQQAMVERTLKMYRQVLEAPLSQTSLVLAGRTSDATASAPELDQTASI
jgi:hypothetical protein